MKRFSGWLAILLTLALLMGGISAVAEAAAPVELTYLTWRSDAASLPIWVREYEAETGNKVNVVYTTIDQYQAVLKSRLLAKDDVDVFDLWTGGNFIDAAREGACLDLTEYPWMQERFSESELGYVAFEGRHYGAPNAFELLPMMYNKTIFDQYELNVPKTWNELLDVCKTLRENGVDPIAIGGKDFYTPQWLWYQIAQNSFDLTPQTMADLVEGKVLFTDEIFVKPAQAIEELVKNGYFINGVLGTGYSQSVINFAQGGAAMCVTGSWDYRTILENAMEDYEFSMFATPGIEGPVELVVTCPGDAVAVASFSPHLEAALGFVEFWTRPEVRAICANESGTLLTGQGIEYTNEICRIISDFAAQYERAQAQITLYLADSGEHQEMLSNALSRVLNGMSAEESFAKAALESQMMRES